jgi:hypothetical protein
MVLKGVHFLLTYRCDLECDHCFVWSSPDAKGTFTFRQLSEILDEARKLESVNYVSIEGGESVKHGFNVEVLSNCYWATCKEDAIDWLFPLAEAGNVELTLSSDLYHGDEWITDNVRNAVEAAKALNLKTGIIAVAYPHAKTPCPKEIEGIKVDLWELMYRGRACAKLADKESKKSWREFTKCPYEDFTNQERVHIDPFGYVHVCQGITIGNLWKKNLLKNSRGV